MKIVLFLSIALFLAACSVPALFFQHSQGPNDPMYGINVLAVGWSGIFAGIFAWYANPLWLFGLVMGFIRKPLWSVVPGLLALALAVTTWSVLGRELPADEGNVTKMTLVRLLPGFYLWMVSLTLVPIAAAFSKK